MVPVKQAGAYGIVVDADGRLLVLRAANGRCYLPGGRIEPGESAEAALVREIEEECGWRAEVGARVAEARHAILDGTVDLVAEYWRVRLVTVEATQPEHELLWLAAEDALGRLHRPGDIHAIRMALPR